MCNTEWWNSKSRSFEKQVNPETGLCAFSLNLPEAMHLILFFTIKRWRNDTYSATWIEILRGLHLSFFKKVRKSTISYPASENEAYPLPTSATEKNCFLSKFKLLRGTIVYWSDMGTLLLFWYRKEAFFPLRRSHSWKSFLDQKREKNAAWERFC